MAELNGLEPSSAWLTTKCLTSRPQFLVEIVLGGSKGVEPLSYAVTVRRFTIKLRPTEDLAGMTRLELANQLIEGQPAFHFAFIPRRLVLANLRFVIVKYGFVDLSPSSTHNDKLENARKLNRHIERPI
jgi:hypothetical protein